MERQKSLDKLGKMLMADVRDKVLDGQELLLTGRLRASAKQDYQARIAKLPPDQKELLREVIAETIDTTLHDLLFALEVMHDRGGPVELMLDGKPASDFSDGLQGELFGAEGWIARFSRHPWIRDHHSHR